MLKSEAQKDRAQLSIKEPLTRSLFTRQDGSLDAWHSQPMSHLSLGTLDSVTLEGLLTGWGSHVMLSKT